MSKWMPIALASTMLAGTLVPAPAAAKAVCDRTCLIKLTDAYVATFAGHSLAGVPLESTAAIVENVTPIKAGDGLWKTVQSGPTQFQVHVPDPVNETAGWLGMMQVDGKPTMVAIRLKLDKDGKIAEAEHLYAAVAGPSLKNTESLRPGLTAEVPAANRKSHDELIRIGKSYYDALDDNDGSKMPFAADCERHENGMITAGPNAGALPAAALRRHTRPRTIARDRSPPGSSSTSRRSATAACSRPTR